ncbi:MAG: NTPase [Candidatus Bathyarchaeota archaeon]|nr:MAG: NTPase [Candidatus Bathyarchaeota archaeon]
MKRIILLTGPPCIGKSSVFHRTVNSLKQKGLKIGGMLSADIREGGSRVGFEIMDLSTGQKGWLAHINQFQGPKISKYTVNLVDLDVLGASAIVEAIQHGDVIAIDEVGPMELSSTAFSAALVQAIESNKPLLATIHCKSKHPLVENLKGRPDAEIVHVTYENRKTLHAGVSEKLTACLVPA